MLMRVAAGEARTRIAVGAVRVWGPPARHAARAIWGVVDELTGRRRRLRARSADERREKDRASKEGERAEHVGQRAGVCARGKGVRRP